MFEPIKNFLKKSADSVTYIFKAPNDNDISYNWTKSKGLTFYQTSLYLNRAINKRADKVGEIEFVLKQKNAVISNDWADLLNKPNKNQPGYRFWKLYQKYKDVFGEAYILKVEGENTKIFDKNKAVGKKAPAELRLLEPFAVTKKYNADKTDIVSFDYSYNGVKQTYLPDQIIYSFNPDPKNQLEGESLISSGLRSLEVETQANEYQAKAIKTGGKIDTLVKVKNALNSEQVDAMRENYKKIRKQMWEEGNVDDPFFAGGDIDVVRLALNPAELSYLESRKMSIDDIVALTNVPKALLGLSSNDTYANADAAIKIFLRDTIKPLMTELKFDLDWQLIPDEFDLDFIDPTPSEKEEVRQNIKLASDIYAISTNEKRKLVNDLLGAELSDIPNGDEVLAPISLMPIGDSSYQNDPTAQDPTADPNAKKKDLKRHHPLNDEARRAAFREARGKKLDRSKKRVLRTVKEFFRDQEIRVTGYLQKALKTKSIIDDAFNLNLEIKLAKASILPVIRDLFIEAGQEHLSYLGVNEDFNFTSTMEASLNKRADFFAKTINETQYDKLKSAFENASAESETRDQLVDRIKGVYGNIQDGWAEVIARTESHTALQGGTLEALHQADMPIKIWVHGIGIMGGVRDDHISMDGDEVPRNQVFHYPSGATAQAPGLSGDPEEDINCQCWVA